MIFFPKLREFLRYSYKRKANQKRTFLVLRTFAMLDRDNFEGFVRGIKKGAVK